MGRNIIYIILILVANVVSFSAAATENGSCQLNRELESKCSSYFYNVVKPLLDYVRQLKDELDKSQFKDREITTLKEQLIHQGINEAIIRELRAQIEATHRKTNGNSDVCEEKLTENVFKLGKCANELKRQNISLVEKDQEIDRLKAQIINNVKASELQGGEIHNNYIKLEEEVKSCQIQLNNLNTTLSRTSGSCNGFEKNSGTLIKIKLPGMKSFNVLMDNQTTGPDWIVIQQRIGGKESFNRDWVSYRDGFGSFDSDFFLGLEKIHQLTSSQRYELYVHKQSVDGVCTFARYNDFQLAGEDKSYELTNLGEFRGNSDDDDDEDDELRSLEQTKFSTFDHVNVKSDVNCADYFESGWWYRNLKIHGVCLECNLNAPYGKIRWKVDLAKVKMLIRPY